ncbi:hypothetical protein B0A52_03171 [Exophiala mesophila]|uniref:Uncharacterized protein n=1 Tax=Exophiala mesophila TaxID=212818 RepID=A0A438NAL5_EXOME|nr:hypothetical protein B0A52_03171 [Exophiala mesophila]
MPAEIPGYYFDASKNRYFKIQANHIASGSSSSAATKYSRQAVNAEKLIHKTNKREKRHKASKAAQTVKRSVLSKRSLLEFGWRLGDKRNTSAEIVKTFYATSISGRNIYTGPRSPCGQFAFEHATGNLLTATSSDERQVDPTPTILISKPKRPRQVFSQAPESAWSDVQIDLWRQLRHNITHILSLRYGRSVWVSQDHLPDEYSAVILATHNEPDPHAHGLPDIQLVFQGIITGLTKSPSGERLATSGDRANSYVAEIDHFRPAIENYQKLKDQTCVKFQDENVIVFGGRNGQATLCDVRDQSATVMRLQHSSGVAHIQPLANSGQPRLLIQGTLDMKVYDLRYCPIPTRQPGSSSSTTAHNRHKMPRRYLNSPPVTTFSMSATRQPNNFNLGFAYDPELNLVASASTDHHSNHRIGLWDVANGHMVESPLNAVMFGAQVTCAEFVDWNCGTTVDGSQELPSLQTSRRSGAKSLLLATAGGVRSSQANPTGMWEWSVN